MPKVIQCLSDADYKAKVADPTFAKLAKVWEDHTGTVAGRANAHPPMFDLTIAQKAHFSKLVTLLRLGLPIDFFSKPRRRVEVAVA